MRPGHRALALLFVLAAGCSGTTTTHDAASDPIVVDTVVVDVVSPDTLAVDTPAIDTVAVDGGRDTSAPEVAVDVPAVDLPVTDAGADVPAQVDVPMCLPSTGGVCGGDLMCLCCPAGGPRMNCLCTTPCTRDAECTDSTRPVCNRPSTGSSPGICAPAGFACAWGAVCAAADTPIATPDGERPIADLAVGDRVYGLRGGALVPVRVVQVGRTRVFRHAVVRVTLRNGREVSMSAGHPTVEGGTFGALATGGELGGAAIARTELVPYAGEHTYDLRTDGEQGAYVAAGVLVGSTLAPR